MPAIDDQIRIKMISEMQGVQMSTDLYFTVDDLIGGPTVLAILFDVATEWQSAWKAVVSDQFKITCAIYSNITDQTEPSIPLFVNLPGLEAIENPHPANTVVYCTRYGVHQGNGKLVVGRVAISGITLNHSLRGRVKDDMELSTVETFFKNPLISVASGFTLKQNVRYLFSPGPPKLYEQSTITQAQMQGEFTKLQSRQTHLCAVP
jgi:hypothetical protein